MESVTGEASITAPGKVEVKAADGTTQVLEGKNILISTGCVTRSVPSLPLNGTTIIGSREAMVLEKRPESMIIIGSGAIGTEFAYIYNSFGTKVTLIEALPRILPNEDDDSCQTLERAFKKQGIKTMTGVSVESVTETCDGKVKALVKNSKGQEEEITADICLVAIGVKPVVRRFRPGIDGKGIHQGQRPLCHVHSRRLCGGRRDWRCSVGPYGHV